MDPTLVDPYPAGAPALARRGRGSPARNGSASVGPTRGPYGPPNLNPVQTHGPGGVKIIIVLPFARALEAAALIFAERIQRAVVPLTGTFVDILKIKKRPRSQSHISHFMYAGPCMLDWIYGGA